MPELKRQLDLCGIPHEPEENTLRLATWNVRRLGSTEKPELALEYIAEVIRRFDLVTLCEVSQRNDDLKRLMEFLGETWSVAHPSEPSDPRSVGNCVFVYRLDRVQPTNLAGTLPYRAVAKDDSSSEWMRPPFVLGFRSGGFQFAVIGVHVKLGKSIGERNIEHGVLAAAVREWAEANRESYSNVFLTGTHQANMPVHMETLTGQGLMVPVPLPLVRYSNFKKSMVFDGILCFEGTAERSTGRGGVVDYIGEDRGYLFPDETEAISDMEFSNRLSDHLPIWLEINTGSLAQPVVAEMPEMSAAAKEAFSLAGGGKEVDLPGLLAGMLLRYSSERSDSSRFLFDILRRESSVETGRELLDEIGLSHWTRDSDGTPSDPINKLNQSVRALVWRAQRCAEDVSDSRRVTLRHLVGAMLFAPQEGFRRTQIGAMFESAGIAISETGAAWVEAKTRVLPEEATNWKQYVEQGMSNPNIIPVVPGFDADDLLGPDKLGIMDDVRTLSAVIMAERWKPPLSIGLFGDWGSGKSFFIEKMLAYISLLASKSRDARKMGEPTVFVSEVAQIRFNAWHFIDTNLWASMVLRIYEGLAEALFGPAEDKADAEQREAQEGIFRQLDACERKIDELRQERDALVAKEATARDRLARDRSELGPVMAGLKQLGEFKGKELIRFLQDNPDLEKRVREVSRLSGVEDLGECVERLRDQYAELCAKGAWFVERWKWAKKNPWKAGGAAAVVTAGAVIGLIDWTSVYSHPLFINVASGVTSLTTLGGTLWKSYGERLNAVINLAQSSQNLFQAEAETKGTEDLAVVDAKLDERLKEAEEHNKKLEQLEIDFGLESFLRERAVSSDYGQYLGIIALVRRDFKRLAKLLGQEQDENKDKTKASAKAPDPAKGKELRCDRIILYIDDLDRCPPDRVVEVLQAVHMMLSLKLFVVVVAADPRWLLHSLRNHYSELFTRRGKLAEIEGISEEEAGAWTSTPQNYLDKIFQIPFSVAKMNDAGYEQLVDRLFRKDADTGQTERSAIAAAKPAEAPAQAATEPGKTPAAAPGTPVPPPKVSAGATAGAQVSPVPTVQRKIDLTPSTLNVSEWELKLIRELSCLISTPRATKRLANVYRLIRAGRPENKLSLLIGTEKKAGDYQAVLVLLGILIGYPEQAPDLLCGLFTTTTETFRQFVEEDLVARRRWSAGKAHRYENNLCSEMSEYESGRWDALRETLLALLDKLDRKYQMDLQSYRNWTPRVARYSFRAGHIVGSMSGEAGQE